MIVILMRTLIGFFLMAVSVQAGAQTDRSRMPLGACFVQARQERTPGERDRRRRTCLQRFTKNISLDECLRNTRRFEYFLPSEEAKKACLFQEPTKLNVKNCLKTARSLGLGENRDEVLWSCIREIPSSLSQKSCLLLAREMVFSPYRQRATSYCSTELISR
ncbi:MAG TPA: hypothetical protein PL182_12465 [Pseudobdellovibrionaceae bacterium]|nr:hypothetical protein [Pseudobdellovibrionaceae bacterium]